MQSRRKCVVRGLAHIHIIIRMAELLPGQFVCPVGNHFVGIHIGLSA